MATQLKNKVEPMKDDMKAIVTYEVAYGPNPWSKNKEDAWILWRRVAPQFGLSPATEPVAIFNYDSEARLFMAFIHANGYEKIELPTDLLNLFKRQSEKDCQTPYKRHGGT